MGFFWEQITSDFFLWHPSLVTRFQKKKKKKRKEKKRKEKERKKEGAKMCSVSIMYGYCYVYSGI